MHNRQLINENHDIKNKIDALSKKLHSEYERIGQIEALVIANKPDLAYSLASILDIKMVPEKEDFASIKISTGKKLKKPSNT
jgi:ribosome-binding protein aMBF1 (putative translation factor)